MLSNRTGSSCMLKMSYQQRILLLCTKCWFAKYVNVLHHPVCISRIFLFFSVKRTSSPRRDVIGRLTSVTPLCGSRSNKQAVVYGARHSALYEGSRYPLEIVFKILLTALHSIPCPDLVVLECSTRNLQSVRDYKLWMDLEKYRKSFHELFSAAEKTDCKNLVFMK